MVVSVRGGKVGIDVTHKYGESGEQGSAIQANEDSLMGFAKIVLLEF